MKHFTCGYDVPHVGQLVQKAIDLKEEVASPLGKGKTLGLVFMNPSLRTRLSTQKAAMQLGMNILSINAATEGWALEFSDDAMTGTTVEHIEEAAAVMGEYCDIIGVRSFPTLTDKKQDDSEKLLLQWMKYSGKQILSLESATRHPLQSLADIMTIKEHKLKRKPKVVLTWAPHVKAVPHAVANSFSEWMKFTEAEFMITHPKGLELKEEFTSEAKIIYDQNEALEGADFVYAKSWCSYSDYGKFVGGNGNWLLSEEKMKITNNAKILHCLPVRRDVELPASLLRSANSLVIDQAANRVHAAQAVLEEMLAFQSGITAKQSLNKFPHEEQ